MAAPGDWPWHVTLHRDDTHVCDGTLISENWVLTTESCFQGQPKATWIAVIGNVRLSSSTPWTQRRRIVRELNMNLCHSYMYISLLLLLGRNGKIAC